MPRLSDCDAPELFFEEKLFLEQKEFHAAATGRDSSARLKAALDLSFALLLFLLFLGGELGFIRIALLQLSLGHFHSFFCCVSVETETERLHQFQAGTR